MENRRISENSRTIAASHDGAWRFPLGPEGHQQ